MTKFLLYWNTLKYLKPVQIYGRIFSVFKKKSGLIKLPVIPDNLTPDLDKKTNFIYHEPWNKREELISGDFTFLNKTKSLGFPPRWNIDNSDLLWQFNLHYFNYLHLLNKEEQLEICYDWIDKNKLGKGTACHPYVISLRLISWCKIGFEDEKINKSIYLQASYLYRNLEYCHPANHYLENARALIFTGLYFSEQGESKKWLQKGLEIYLTETPKQILNDGGHFERSIMYHAIMLEGYLDIINILPSENKNFNLLLNNSTEMLAFLEALTHPDGKISLFNDSTQEIAPSTRELIEYAKKLNITTDQSVSQSDNHPINQSKAKPCIKSFNDSGYYVYKDEDIYIAIDGGAIGPNNIPAHTHADIFSYELSIKGVQFIVDSGVYEYADGEIRNYTRSTKAHNTVCIDNKDQAECWGSFRVARRYKPYDVSFIEKDGKVFFQGKFGGYSKLIGDDLVHHRKLEIGKNEAVINIEDEITGNGNHIAESFIHLHPEVKIEEIDNSLILTRDKVEVKFKIQNYKFEIIDSWYYPEFGKKTKNSVIKIISNQIPARIEYSLKVRSLKDLLIERT